MVFLAGAEPVRFFHKDNRAGRLARSDVLEPSRAQLYSQDSHGEYAFNLAAFFDGRRNLVRIFTEIEPKYVRPIVTGDLTLPHVNKCSFTSANGSTWSTKTISVDTQWAYGDDERIRTVNKVLQLFHSTCLVTWDFNKTLCGPRNLAC